MNVIYFQPPGIKPNVCKAGMFSETYPEYIWYLDNLCKNYKPTGKVPTLTTELAHSTGKNVYPKILVEIFDVLGYYRRLTPIETERLQTVPDDYTRVVADTERYRMLGNGWTVDVIAHIFSFLKGVEFIKKYETD